jgi:dihydroorotate dehydrogenase
MYDVIRSILFRFDPEWVHALVLGLIKWAGVFPPTCALLRAAFDVDDPGLQVEAFGVKFKNPIGLAAGYDKNGVAVAGLSALGFGHVEVGTVTRQKQIGNPRPRLHRVPEAQALINSMGFPNDGADALCVPFVRTAPIPGAAPGRSALPERGDYRRRGGARIGINIGKSKDTPVEAAADDYCALLRLVYRRADYVALNVSSPNTMNLRQLQARAAIEDLLKAVASVRDGLSPRVPLLVKIAPDLTETEVDDVLGAIALAGIDGIIATNTTVAREGIPAKYRELKGGLSGAPLRARSTEMVRYIAQRTSGRLPIIGVGGVASGQDAREKLDAGASLVQMYTGLVYAGPGLARRINRALSDGIPAAPRISR